MRVVAAAAALLAVTVAPALAQNRYPPRRPPAYGYNYAPVPPGANPETGARPGNVIGTGNSLPMSDHAANINPNDTRSLIAPRLPNPPISENSSPRQFLMAARQALQSGQTGIAQEALERAEARQLDRSVAPSQASEPIRGPIVGQISSAREALGNGNIGGAIQIIDQVLQQLPPA